MLNLKREPQSLFRSHSSVLSVFYWLRLSIQGQLRRLAVECALLSTRNQMGELPFNEQRTMTKLGPTSESPRRKCSFPFLIKLSETHNIRFFLMIVKPKRGPVNKKTIVHWDSRTQYPVIRVQLRRGREEKRIFLFNPRWWCLTKRGTILLRKTSWTWKIIIMSNEISCSVLELQQTWVQ